MNRSIPSLTIFAAVLLVSLTATACASGRAEADSDPNSPLNELADRYPVPELSPDEVVGIQMAALQANNEDDFGITIAFRFASPTNRRNTGPEERFAGIIRTPSYAPMLNSTSFEARTIEANDSAAFVAVRVMSADGRGAAYVFALSRQDGGAFEDCWMTDGVLLIGARPSAPSFEQALMTSDV